MKRRKISTAPLLENDPILNNQLKEIEQRLFRSTNNYQVYQNLSEIFLLVDQECCKWMLLQGNQSAKALDSRYRYITDEAHHLAELLSLSAKVRLLMESIENEAYQIEQAMLRMGTVTEQTIYKDLL